MPSSKWFRAITSLQTAVFPFHKAQWDDLSCRDRMARPALTILGAELLPRQDWWCAVRTWLGSVCLSSHMGGFCTPGLWGTRSWPNTVLKGVSLVSLTIPFATPDCTVACDGQLPAELCLLLTLSVSSPF